MSSPCLTLSVPLCLTRDLTRPETCRGVHLVTYKDHQRTIKPAIHLASVRLKGGFIVRAPDPLTGEHGGRARRLSTARPARQPCSSVRHVQQGHGEERQLRDDGSPHKQVHQERVFIRWYCTYTFSMGHNLKRAGSRITIGAGAHLCLACRDVMSEDDRHDRNDSQPRQT